MANDNWRSITLRDFVTLQRGHDLPVKQRRLGDIPILGSFGITGWHDEARAKGPGITVGRSGGSLGVVTYSSCDFWPLNTALYVTDFHGNYERYAYYFLKTIDFARYNSGSAQPSLNRNYIYSIPITVPHPDEQRDIARVLGALDDKITLNRRMNENLEEMARAIFKSWFVDFDPVHAKAEGRQPIGMDADTAALFPNTLETSDIGEIPGGWIAGSLGDIATNIRDVRSPDEIARGTPYIALEHMPRRSIALDTWVSADEVESNKYAFKEGDILFGKLRPYFHKVGVAPLDGVCSTDVLVIRPESPEWYGMVLETVSSKRFVDYTDSASTGTKMPRTNWKDMSDYRLALPPPRIAEAFMRTTLSMVRKIIANIRESKALADMRDTLLPKLLSGDISLSEEAFR